LRLSFLHTDNNEGCIDQISLEKILTPKTSRSGAKGTLAVSVIELEQFRPHLNVQWRCKKKNRLIITFPFDRVIEEYGADYSISWYGAPHTNLLIM
jgi:hypothetical protein